MVWQEKVIPTGGKSHKYEVISHYYESRNSGFIHIFQGQIQALLRVIFKIFSFYCWGKIYRNIHTHDFFLHFLSQLCTLYYAVNI